MRRSLALIVFALAITCAVPQAALATHFRYGHLFWSAAGGPPNTVQLHLYCAFRRNGYTGSAPDGFPAIGDIIQEDIGDTGLNFGDGTSTAVLKFYVLNVDSVRNWLYAVALAPNSSDPTTPLLHTYSGPGPWVANIDTCCRISSSRNAGDGPYRVETIVDLTKTQASPTSSLPVIVQCRAGFPCLFTVPATDSGNQLLLYRLATDAESYLGQPTGLMIDSITGIGSWNTPNDPGGLYSAQYVIEKRERTNPTNLQTKVSVDFLIQLFQAVPDGVPPTFLTGKPTCGQQVTINSGETLQQTVAAQSNNTLPGLVGLNVVGQPANSSFSPSLPTSGSPTVVTNFLFNPGDADANTYQMNFSATEYGLQTTCGYSVLVPAPNKVVSLTGNRSGTRLRFQTKTSAKLCSAPSFEVYRRIGDTPGFELIKTVSTTFFDDTITGPAGTVNRYAVGMRFADGCATGSITNVASFIY